MKKLIYFAISFLLILVSGCEKNKNSIEKWGVFEEEYKYEHSGNPYTEIELFATFRNGEEEKKVRGFYDDNAVFKVRFMPHKTGQWEYKTESNIADLDGITGSFECIKPGPGNYGPVRVARRYHFEYAEGKPYYQVGTTAYAWIHQGDSLEEKTLETLSKSAFNKIRMCVFPKSYLYNLNEPEYNVFERDSLGNNDFTSFNPEYFKHLEKRLGDLMELEIEADIILFHPYDRWGYQSMSDTLDQFYLEYLISRIASFRNVWWSAANEFDFMQAKTMDDWHRYFEIIAEEDPYDHLRSIHNGTRMYDHSLPWITHASLQSTHFDSALVWKERWKKPLVYDECRYEGDVPQGWGNMSGQEMTAMFWKSLTTGTYAGHGECFLHPEDILWWSKGGELHGNSPERILFFKDYLNEIPKEGYDTFGDNFGGRYGEQYLWYFENDTPEILDADLPSQVYFKAEIIDTWNMSVEKLNESYHGEVSIPLPSKSYIAVRFIKEDIIFPIKPVQIISDGNLFYRDIRVDFQHHKPAGIRYTLDGSEPGPESRKYEGAFTINENTILKSIVIEGERKSIITEVNFQKADLMPALDISNPEPGFAWKSYLGEWTELPKFRWLRPESKGRTTEINLDMAPADDYFGMTFTGYIEIPYDEVYSFFAFSDDGSAIYIDGKLVTLNDGQHGAREEMGQVGLETGIHKIEVHYFDNWYEEVLEVYVSAPGMGRQNINSMVVLE